jgi:hypothetical protein
MIKELSHWQPRPYTFEQPVSKLSSMNSISEDVYLFWSTNRAGLVEEVNRHILSFILWNASIFEIRAVTLIC